jgi:hypothetical protein
MNRSELIELIVKRAGISKEQATIALDCIIKATNSASLIELIVKRASISKEQATIALSSSKRKKRICGKFSVKNYHSHHKKASGIITINLKSPAKFKVKRSHTKKNASNGGPNGTGEGDDA